MFNSFYFPLYSYLLFALENNLAENFFSHF